MAKDFLKEIVDERTRRNPEFPSLVAEAEARRKLARKLTALREKIGKSARLEIIKGADHFFGGSEAELSRVIAASLRS